MVCTAHGALHFPFAERESHRMDEAGCARAPPSLDMVIVVADTELLPFMTEQLAVAVPAAFALDGSKL